MTKIKEKTHPEVQNYQHFWQQQKNNIYIIIQVEEDKNDDTNNTSVCACEDINPSPEMYLKTRNKNANWSILHQ